MMRREIDEIKQELEDRQVDEDLQEIGMKEIAACHQSPKKKRIPDGALDVSVGSPQKSGEKSPLKRKRTETSLISSGTLRKRRSGTYSPAKSEPGSPLKSLDGGSSPRKSADGSKSRPTDAKAIKRQFKEEQIRKKAAYDYE